MMMKKLLTIIIYFLKKKSKHSSESLHKKESSFYQLEFIPLKPLQVIHSMDLLNFYYQSNLSREE